MATLAELAKIFLQDVEAYLEWADALQSFAPSGTYRLTSARNLPQPLRALCEIGESLASRLANHNEQRGTAKGVLDLCRYAREFERRKFAEVRDSVAAHLELLALAPATSDKGEARAGAESTPPAEDSNADSTRQSAVTSGAAREAVLRDLKSSARKAYLAFQYAETMNGRRMEDREAYDWLHENGIDQGKGDLGELTDYELPDSLETFRRYLGTARKSLGESKYTKRGGRKHGRSIVRGNEIEYQKGDGA